MMMMVMRRRASRDVTLQEFLADPPAADKNLVAFDRYYLPVPFAVRCCFIRC